MAANPNDPCQCGGVFTIRSKSGAYFLGCSNYGSKKCTQQRTLKHRIEVYQGASPSATPGASSAAGSQEHASPVALKLQPDAGISVSPGSAGSLAARDAPPSYLSPVPVKREAAPSYQSPGKREAAPPAAGEGGPAKPGGTCSKCGGIWIIKSNSWTGANFLGCSNYWSTKKCKNTAVYQGASPSATHGTSSSQQAARSQAQTSPAALKIEHASGISASPGSAGSLSARDAPPHQSPAPGKREATATLATGAGGSTLAPLPSRDAAGVSASTGATRDPPPLLSPPPGKREAPPPYQSPGKREAVGISASTGATGTLATRDAPPPYHSPLPVKREAAAPPAGAGAGAGGSAKKPRGGDTAGAKGAKGAKGAAKGWTLEDDEAVLVDPGVPDSIRRCIEELVGRSRGEGRSTIGSSSSGRKGPPRKR
ncbi:hypothetical protein T484DRAFT_1847589 [Baffinella frigidus]|nr:hypothetical protein T484DRAFT_1847589 [Cryptophyta sp. CCMP2293]